MKTPRLSLVFGLLLCTAPALPAQVIYVAFPYGNPPGGNVIQEYSAATGAPITTLPNSGRSPQNLALSGNTLYSTNRFDFTVSAYNTLNNGSASGFTSPTNLNDPFGVAAAGNRLYIGNLSSSGSSGPSNTVGVYNATTGATINASLITGLATPFGLAISSNTLYVANSGNNTIGVYDATTGATVSTFTAASSLGLNGPYALAVSGNRLYVSNTYSNNITVYDATTGVMVSAFNSTVSTGLNNPNGLSIAGNVLYVTNEGTTQTNGSVYAYDATTGVPVPGFVPITGLYNPLGIVYSPIPEPSSWIVLLLGGIFLLKAINRKARRATSPPRVPNK